jgi:hypothetical protein
MDVRRQLDETLRALVFALPVYDGRMWSYYDAAGAVASPFYQRLHVAQLQALSMTFPQYSREFDTCRRRMDRQLGSRSITLIAVARKALQKLVAPPAGLLR